MKTITKEELLNLELIKLMIKRLNRNEIPLQSLEDLRDSVLKNSEFCYAHKEAINELSYFINKKHREIEENNKEFLKRCKNIENN